MPPVNRILAVDDNPINLEIIKELFEAEFELQLVDNGKDALKVAQECPPDVVLLDVMMPDLNGYEVCSHFKSDPTLRHSQVIMVSANTELQDRLQGYRTGADDYVTRPFNPDELYAKVCVNLRNKSTFDDAQTQIEDFSGATAEVLELLSNLDQTESGKHLDRIRIYSRLLASELCQDSACSEIDEAFLRKLEQASPLHDVGKIALPDELLNKKEKLTSEERSQLERHTLIGHDILKGLVLKCPQTDFFSMAAEIARWHHESFDGSGYPDGLRKGEIPLAARIVKLVDVFDALTTHEPGAAPPDPVDVRDYLTSQVASKFDPRLLDAMLNCFDDLRTVCQMYQTDESANV